MRILALNGSLRADSANALILAAAVRLAPAGTSVELEPAVGSLPLFNPDLDGPAAPAAVQAFRDRVAAADALLISSPEYARGVPGALKNALDWLVSDHRVAGKRLALLNAASGGAGVATAQLATTLTTMAVQVVYAQGLVGARVRANDPGVDLAVREALAALGAT